MYGKPAPRIVVAEQHFGDRGSSLLAGPEHVEDRRRLLELRAARTAAPHERHGSAILKHDHGPGVHREYAANQLRLNGRQYSVSCL